MNRRKIVCYLIEGEPFINITDRIGYTVEGEGIFAIDYNEPVPPNHQDITSIETWEKWGYRFNYSLGEVREQIEFIFNDTTWESLTEEEKKIVARYYLVDKTQRDEVYTDLEQSRNNYYKIYNYVTRDVWNRGLDITEPPHGLDYKIQMRKKLNPKYIINDLGMLEECIYYETVSNSEDSFGIIQKTYTNPIMKYEADYVYHANGYISQRNVTRTWMMMDGTWSPYTKKDTKDYDLIQARDEGRRRRTNLISKLMMEVAYLLMITEGLSSIDTAESVAIPLMKDLRNGVNDYYEYGNYSDIEGNKFLLYTDLLNANYDWLDNFVPNTGNTLTIRQFILSRIDVNVV